MTPGALSSGQRAALKQLQADFYEDGRVPLPLADRLADILAQPEPDRTDLIERLNEADRTLREYDEDEAADAVREAIAYVRGEE